MMIGEAAIAQAVMAVVIGVGGWLAKRAADRVEERDAEILTRVSDLAEDVDDLSGSIHRLEVTLAEIKGEQSASRERHEALKDSAAEGKRASGTIHGRIDQIKADHGERLARLEATTAISTGAA